MGFRKRSTGDEEIRREIRSHLDCEADDIAERGASREEAAAAANRAFGNAALVMEDARAVWRWPALDGLKQDAKYACRTLARSPMFTAVAVLTLALGIGANVAIFAVVQATLLRPLGYRDPARLTTVLHNGTSPVAPANFLDWKREARSFEAMAAACAWSATLTGYGQAEQVPGMQVTSGLFEMLGVAPLHGRFPEPGEFEAGRDHVVVLSHALWQQRFGGDPRIIGTSVKLSGAPYTVIGVMGPGFRFAPFWVTDAQMWTPLTIADTTNRRAQFLRVFARLRDGLDLRQAQSEMEAIQARLVRSYPLENEGLTARVDALSEKAAGKLKSPLLVLMASVTVVLLIACANLASLALARAAARRQEIAIRRALGASWSRVLRQWVMESIVLSSAGAAAGVLLAYWALAAFKSQTLLRAYAPRIDDAGMDAQVLGIAVLLACVTGVLFGLAPALQARYTNGAEALRSGTRGVSAGRHSLRARGFMVVAEVAMTVALLATAGLLLRSFLAMRALDPGFDPRGVLTANLSLAGQPQLTGERRERFYLDLIQGAKSLGGVESASLTTHLPVAGDVWGAQVHAEASPIPRPGEEIRAVYRVSAPEYFHAFGMRLVAGRDFTRADTLGSPGVVIINQRLARRLWGKGNALGRRLTTGDPVKPDWRTVVGVIADARQGSWTGDVENEFYLPLAQDAKFLNDTHPSRAAITLVVRANGDPGALVQPLRDLVGTLNRDVPVSQVRPFTEAIGAALWQDRLQTTLVAAFALFALLLAAIGIYGVLAYGVSLRAQEIGMRMALGAGRTNVVWLVLRQSAALAGTGLVLGLGLAAVAARSVSSLLYGIRPGDPATFAAVVALLGAVALIAGWLPARKASLLDPAVSLRVQ